MAQNDKVREIKGTITLADGTTSEFRIGTDFGWQQWGADQPRLGRSVDVMDALVAGLREENVVVVSDGDDDDGEEPSDAGEQCWLEPIGFGDGIYGPYADEVEASMALDADEFMTDETHKIVWRPKPKLT